MHDNTLARAVNRRFGVECLLIPTYTPIRTDEENVSLSRVFLGGITVYLEEKIPFLRHVPRWLLGWLNQPWLIRWATHFTVKTDPAQLGALTVSLLRGTSGHQRRDIQQLVAWLRGHVQPHVVVLSNILIGGCIPELKRQLGCPVVVTLQGDDIFLDELHEPYRHQAVAEIRKLVHHVDAFLVHSQYYGRYMGQWFELPAAKIHRIPLCIDPSGLPDPRVDNEQRYGHSSSRPLVIGYLARLAPEKGLHLLVDAFLKLKQMPAMHSLRLAVAGWLGAQHRKYAEEQFAKIRAAGWSDDFSYAGTVDRSGKARFLQSVDVLAVPTIYPDPKGLFVLEALAAGVPVVEPNHGAFPELLQAAGGGVLFQPRDAEHLAARLHELLTQPHLRRRYGLAGCQYVRENLTCDRIADEFLRILGAVCTEQSNGK